MRMLLVGACFLFPLAMLAGSVNRAVADDDKDKIKANLAKLSEADRKIAEAQKICPIEGESLGSSGVPIKLTVKGEVVFICCGGCKEEVEKNPEKTLKKVAELKKKNAEKK